MVAYLPIPGGHIKLAERFFDPALSFTIGWFYWYNWTIILPAELSAAAVLINYWTTSIDNSVWIIICLAVVVVINSFGAGMYSFSFIVKVLCSPFRLLGIYGEAEFIFASIKVVTIVGEPILASSAVRGSRPHLRQAS